MGRSGPVPLLEDPLECGPPAGLSQRQLDDALASEYVLDVLEPDERTEAEARISSEPGFARRVANWQALMSEAQTLPEVPRHRAAGGDFPRLSAPGVRAFGRPGRLFRDGLRFGAGMGVAAALVLLTVALVAFPRPGLIAKLAAPDNRLSYEIAEYGTALKVTRVAGDAATGNMVHELWLIIPGQGPEPLGFLDVETLVIDHPVPPAGSRFAVSLEPKGGAVGVQPSGPMILMADLER